MRSSALICLAILGLAACQPPRGTTTSATPPAKISSSLSAHVYTGCLVPLPSTWDRLIASSRLATPTSDSAVAFAISADGSRIFAGDAASPFMGIVELDRSGHATLITPYVSGHDMVGSGEFDGRWLVWMEGNYNFGSPQTIRAWDSLAQRVVTLATGVFEQVAVDRGIAPWVALDSHQAHLYDLGSGKDQVLSGQDPQSSALVWPMVIWSDGVGEVSSLHGASAVTGAGIQLPAALASVRGAQYLVGTEWGLAWTGGHNMEELWFWTDGGQPHLLLRSNDYADAWSVGSTLVGAVGSKSDYLVDLRSGATTEVANRVLGPILNEDALALSRAPSGLATMRAPVTVSVLPSSAFPPLPGC